MHVEYQTVQYHFKKLFKKIVSQARIFIFLGSFLWILMKLRILKPVCPDVAQILPISLRPFVDARYETKPLKMPYIYMYLCIHTHTWNQYHITCEIKVIFTFFKKHLVYDRSLLNSKTLVYQVEKLLGFFFIPKSHPIWLWEQVSWENLCSGREIFLIISKILIASCE